MFASIEARLIDVVVVYKIDWLSRSLMDFAKLVARRVFGTALETGREGRLMDPFGTFGSRFPLPKPVIRRNRRSCPLPANGRQAV